MEIVGSGRGLHYITMWWGLPLSLAVFTGSIAAKPVDRAKMWRTAESRRRLSGKSKRDRILLDPTILVVDVLAQIVNRVKMLDMAELGGILSDRIMCDRILFSPAILVTNTLTKLRLD